MKTKYIPFLIGLLAFYACSRKPEKPTAIVKGQITVNPKVDSTRDYSGINVTIIHRDTSDTADTLFHAVTDTTGNFTGKAVFKKRAMYPMLISRNGNLISSSSVILADNDTVYIDGQIPQFNETVTIKSRENTAYSVYQRVEQNYNRLVKYVNSGALPQDTIPHLIQTWSNLFWSVRKDYPNTIAADRSTVNAIQLLSGAFDQELLHKYDSLKVSDSLRDILAKTATDAAARTYGLNGAIQYIDSLRKSSQNPKYRMTLSMNQIKLLYDSTEINRARSDLLNFRKQYDKKFSDAKEWAENFQYDLDHLAPGMEMPSFKVVTLSGDTVSNETLKGKPYLLEITGLANKLYQNQFPQMKAIYLVYKNFGLQYVTVPIDKSQVTVNAFFDERGKNWPVAKAGSYKNSDMLKRFNVQLIPTRFLVDSNGKIIRKYVGMEVDRLISDLKLAFKKNTNS
ncbi:MAG TPA: thioredoxin-like domain-containing protein [Balneolales bacterium]|nr:thioredoxin-like domain-containing protein [Balneolales bacterium]